MVEIDHLGELLKMAGVVGAVLHSCVKKRGIGDKYIENVGMQG